MTRILIGTNSAVYNESLQILDVVDISIYSVKFRLSEIFIDVTRSFNFREYKYDRREQ